MTIDASTATRPFRTLGLIAALAAATAAGMTAGWLLKPDRSAPTAAAPRNDSREAMAERNAVWRVLNGKDDDVTDGPAKSLGFALKAALDKDSPVLLRDRAMGALMNKSVLYFSEEEIDEVMGVMAQGDSADRAEVLRRILAADDRACEFVRGVLADKQRIALFTAGKPIPLETLPDGSAP